MSVVQEWIGILEKANSRLEEDNPVTEWISMAKKVNDPSIVKYIMDNCPDPAVQSIIISNGHNYADCVKELMKHPNFNKITFLNHDKVTQPEIYRLLGEKGYTFSPQEFLAACKRSKWKDTDIRLAEIVQRIDLPPEIELEIVNLGIDVVNKVINNKKSKPLTSKSEISNEFKNKFDELLDGWLNVEKKIANAEGFNIDLENKRNKILFALEMNDPMRYIAFLREREKALLDAEENAMRYGKGELAETMREKADAILNELANPTLDKLFLRLEYCLRNGDVREAQPWAEAITKDIRARFDPFAKGFNLASVVGKINNYLKQLIDCADQAGVEPSLENFMTPDMEEAFSAMRRKCLRLDEIHAEAEKARLNQTLDGYKNLYKGGLK